MERIFYSDWIYACHTSQLAEPGDCETFDIDTESVIVSRDQQMNIQAFANVCRHRGSRICPNGSSKNKRLSCPYHAWTYGLDGKLLVARLMPDDFNKSDYGLKKITTEVFCGMVFVNLSESPESFEEVKERMQGALATFELENTRLAHYESHPIDANWKLTYENFFECYHCGPAHKEYAASHSLSLDVNRREGHRQKLIERADKAGISTERVEISEAHPSKKPQYYYHRSALYDGFQTASEDGKPVAPLLGSIKAYDGGASDIMLGTLTYLVVYADHAVLYRFSPRSVDQTDAEIFWFVRDDAEEADVDMERLKWLWHVTTVADKKIIEDNQQGVNSRFYEPGPYSPMEEPTMGFIEWYLARIS
jgi:Rieske 2Fe-2S family protein